MKHLVFLFPVLLSNAVNLAQGMVWWKTFSCHLSKAYGLCEPFELSVVLVNNLFGSDQEVTRIWYFLRVRDYGSSVKLLSLQPEE